MTIRSDPKALFTRRKEGKGKEGKIKSRKRMNCAERNELKRVLNQLKLIFK